MGQAYWKVPWHVVSCWRKVLRHLTQMVIDPQMEGEGIRAGEHKYIMWTSHREDQTDSYRFLTHFVSLVPLCTGSGGPGIVEESEEGEEDGDV